MLGKYVSRAGQQKNQRNAPHPLITSCIELEGNRKGRRADEGVTHGRSNQNRTHNNF